MEEEVKMTELKILVPESEISQIGLAAHSCDLTLNEYITDAIMQVVTEDLGDY